MPLKKSSPSNTSSVEAVKGTEAVEAVVASDKKANDGLQAKINGLPLDDIPQDFYIHPEALNVVLDSFEGPMDLLLYLVRRDNMDVMQLNLQRLTEQYLQYIELMESLQIEVAGQYMVMAATLAEYKSRRLLPQIMTEEDEEDPTEELTRKLKEYEKIKQIATELDGMPREEREFFVATASLPTLPAREVPPSENKILLFKMAKRVLVKIDKLTQYHTKGELLPLNECISNIMSRLEVSQKNFVLFEDICDPRYGRHGVVMTVLALLDLLHKDVIELVQTALYGAIRIRHNQNIKPL